MSDDGVRKGGIAAGVLGASCVFVGCEGECVPAPRGVMGQIEAAHYREAETFVAEFMALMIYKLPRGLRFVAAAGGPEPEVHVVRAQRG